MNTESNNPQPNIRGRNVSPAASLSSSTNGAGSSLARESSNLMSDLGDMVKSATPFSAEDLARAKETITARVTAARDSVVKFGGEVATRARSTATATDTYVHEKPWQSIAIGAAAGLLIGMLLARRS